MDMSINRGRKGRKGLFFTYPLYARARENKRGKALNLPNLPTQTETNSLGIGNLLIVSVPNRWFFNAGIGTW